MGLSESVLSCLPFIAGQLYLADPLPACIYMRTHTRTHTCMPACRRKHAAVLCGLAVTVQTCRYGFQEAGKKDCDDKTHVS